MPHKKKQKQKAILAIVKQGRMDVTRSGMSYVIIENENVDVLVRPPDFGNALHGDIVRVEVTKENPRTKRKEGRVVEVLHRKQTEFIGQMDIGPKKAYFIPDTQKKIPDFLIPPEKLNNAKHQDAVLVRWTEWKKENRHPRGEVIAILQADQASDMAMKEILTENGFPITFEKEIIEEAQQVPDCTDEAEIKKRKDYRNTFTITIDPADAKDFDDALSIKKIDNDLYEIGVHIADVSHYVQAGTALDTAAYTRATSVYLPDRVVPMLPERISNELCSLRPKEDKLTFSAVFHINTKAEIKKYWLDKTVIHSNHRFTYEEVQETIEQKKGIYLEEILSLNDMAQTLRKQRFQKGAINFSSQEIRFKLDEKGTPIGIIIKESKQANQLVEEFMLLANRIVAEHISKIKVKNKTIPFPYRIHDEPDAQKLLPFIDFARKHGHTFNVSTPKTIAASFNSMLRDVKGKPEQHVLEQLGIRTMAKATYAVDDIGHYGLAFEHYCHFTSPIRRYPDIMAHRILFDCLHNNPCIDTKMEEKCKHSSERERAAMESERAANKYKQVEYMRNFLGQVFEAVISGVASFGLFVETVAHKCEGLVTIQSLAAYDEFRLVEGDYCLVGRRSGRQFKMGDKLFIQVVAASLAKRQLDYEWVIDGHKNQAGKLEDQLNKK
ncbi:MAG TPA: ribonuclease R [Chitinophagaceae bacterium]|nr:ribonuclease R [Chitinophagaceae bacterium]